MDMPGPRSFLGRSGYIHKLIYQGIGEGCIYTRVGYQIKPRAGKWVCPREQVYQGCGG